MTDPKQQAVKAYALACAAAGWRGLVTIEAGVVRQPLDVSCWLPGRDGEAGEVFGITPDAPAAFVRSSLGGECAHALVDLRDGVDADLLGQVSGMLRVGGLLILVLPEIDGDSPFLMRLRALARAPWVLRIGPQGVEGGVLPPAPEDGEVAFLRARKAQAEAVSALLDAVDAGVPAVLTAPRGRGKSAALGMAVARMLETGRASRVVVSAPSRRSLASFFAFAGEVGAGLEFRPPDALEDGLPEDAWLVLDEVAALGAWRLRRLAGRTPRLLMATTTEGYEGSGRGFLLRQIEWLANRHPGLRRLELAHPMRWAPGDPLEKWIDELLCLSSRVLTPGMPAATGELRHEVLGGARLANDEPLLQRVFGLLVSAHYRSRPRDLQRLLDDPTIQVHVLWQAEAPCAVALVQREPGLEAALAQQVFEGRRRPPGRLQAQSLAAHVGLPEAATRDQHRILRIAVAEGMRRRGLGRRLLEAIAERATTGGAAFLGASFAFEPELLDFWTACGFSPVHLGLHRERSTGLPSLLVLRALDARAERMVALAGALMARRFSRLLACGLVDLPEGLVLPGAGAALPGSLLEAERRAYLEGQRGFELALHVLWPEVKARWPLPEPLATLWRLRVEAGYPWPEVARRAGLSGKRAARAAMRAGLRALLSGA